MTRVALVIGLLAAFVLAWQGVASLDAVDDLTLASPVETFDALRDDWSLLMDNAWVTLVEVLLGLGISVVAGVGFAVAMHLYRPLREAAYPLLVASQAIPIVVLAPIFVLAFDYGIGPKLAIVALICFFPLTVNMLDGLRSVEPELLKLMRSLGASRLQSLVKVELPSALPYFFSGLRVAATVSVIGAVFGEWAGADKGLGRLVLLGNTQLQTPRVYAGIVILTLMAVALFALATLAERLACPWNRKEATRVIRPVLLAVLASAALLAAGCGEKEDVLEPKGSKQIELMLDFFPNADHAGIYAAQAGGDFEAVGLDVKIRQPTDPAAVIRQVAAGRVDLAISYEPEVLRARDKGLRVVSVGALVQEPLTSIISLPRADIRRPADLEDKTVGTAGIDYQSAFLRTILLEAGVRPDTVKERNVGQALNAALLTRKVDATLGSFWNYEGTELRLQKRRPRIIRVQSAGVPTYNELVFVANEDALERDSGKIRAFIGAVSRGTRELRSDPAGAIDGLLEANPDLDPRLQRAVVDVTLPLFFPPRGKPFGYQDPAQWNEFAAWMRENKLITKAPDARGAFTNDLLPGSGL
jgi:ABC-type nitrate/sulfonate/bicarbonate transport system permease component/ABC-type nitrate/sulfonate/bicarbonate transport system substrate-binding protein